MSTNAPTPDPWAAATFEGNELEQLQRTAKWTFEQKLDWLEQAYRLSKALQDSRLKQGGPATVRGNGDIENLR